MPGRSMPFGAPRWVASLRRHCDSSTSDAHISGIIPGGRKNILKLAQRTNELFCSGVCASTWSKWENIHVGYLSEDVLFDFLWNERTRSQWDILSLSGAMQEIVEMSKGPGHNDCISILRVIGMDSCQTGMMVVQESWMDTSGSLIIYAPVDASVVADAMNDRDAEAHTGVIQHCTTSSPSQSIRSRSL